MSQTEEVAPPQVEPPDIRAWTDRHREDQRRLGRESLLHFVVGICGLVPTGPNGESQLNASHADMAAFLEGRPPHHPWLRALLCAFRGFSKSVWGRMYAFWRMIHIVNFAVYLVSNSEDNAKKLHFEKIIHLIDEGPRAEYLRWLYSDRIPPGLAGTNTERLTLVQTDTQADPSLTYGGLSTGRRGKHPDLALGDDLEGTDDPKSDVQGVDAWNCYQGLIPLMKHPSASQILIIGTPTEGDSNPLVWRIRDAASKQVLDATGRPWTSEADNAHCSVKVFWKPIIDANGVCPWPERFPPHVVQERLAEPIAGTQYLLRRSSRTLSIFDIPAVTSHFYRRAPGDPMSIVYTGFKFDADKVTEEGYVIAEPSEAVVRLMAMRYYVHFDPLHKSLAQRRSAMRHQRPAKAAAVVVGVAPDNHAFVVETWTGSVGLPEQAEAVFRLYRKWNAFSVTCEIVGAQVWFKAYVESVEKGDPNWGRPTSSGFLSPPAAMPRLSARLVEAEKIIDSKEAVYREALAPWLNRGSLHLADPQRDPAALEIFTQAQEVANENHEVDLIDALSQGPAVWKPPTGDLAAREWAERRAHHEAFVGRKERGALGRTGHAGVGWRGGKW